MKKVLLSGCSFSAASGWGEPDYYKDPRCWYNILAKKHQFDLHNIAYGGHSNREIIHRASQMLLMRSYDLVIVALTSVKRVWYFREKDPLNYVLLNSSMIGHNSSEKHALQTMFVEFNNYLNEIERDLVNLVLLQQYLKLTSTPLLLINFSDFGTKLSHILKDNSFINQDELLLDVNHTRIDLPTYQKRLAKIASMLDLTHSVGFDKNLTNLITDTADDNMHPGEKSNQMFANIISDTLRKIEE
jgi:hypothetical protein